MGGLELVWSHGLRRGRQARQQKLLSQFRLLPPEDRPEHIIILQTDPHTFTHIQTYLRYKPIKHVRMH